MIPLDVLTAIQNLLDHRRLAGEYRRIISFHETRVERSRQLATFHEDALDRETHNLVKTEDEIASLQEIISDAGYGNVLDNPEAVMHTKWWWNTDFNMVGL